MHDGGGVLPFRPWEEVQRRYYLYAHVSSINMVAKSGGKAMKHIKWQAPSVGWIHLNTDGVAKVGVIAGCGVLRGNNGGWICGFSKNISISVLV
ncbi:putative ribonuclease H protein [Trifolium medium]|uniref:Putative ribonuclease H protein n=1 Tax=Trifolium medium TaxID=97028 RepID=A0A392QE49_9FABA|nr:putative ribonuclease H protein [Trifolium medium]